MKLSEYDKDYYGFSAKAGDIARQLALAGIAIVWLFKVDANGSTSLPKLLAWPTIAFVVSLAADLLHYLVQAITWGRFAYVQRKKHGKGDDEVIPDPPGYYNWASLVLFYCKTTVVLVGYWWLFEYLRLRIAFA